MVCFKDLELEYYPRGHLRSINNKLIVGRVFMLDGRETNLYMLISPLHDLPSNQRLCGSTRTPKVPDRRFSMPNPVCPDDPSIVQGFCEV